MDYVVPGISVFWNKRLTENLKYKFTTIITHETGVKDFYINDVKAGMKREETCYE